jgi:hypothetical protein
MRDDSERNPRVEAARNLLGMDFTAEDHAHVEYLSAKARDGSLTPAERAELDKYLKMGHLLALLQSKARMFLNPREND